MSDAVPDEVVVGLDVGTSATKAVAFAPGGWSRLASRDYPLRSPAPDRREQDPRTVAEAVVGTLADLVAILDGAAVRAIAVSAAMHGLLGLDADRQPVTPLVTWADGRALEDARWLLREHPDLHRATGTPMHPMAPIATLRWFTREEPETADRVRWWIGLKDWVLLTLTGELVTEPSSASGTGLLELASGQWHPDAAGLAGSSVDRLPRIVPVDTRLPLADEVAVATGVPEGVEVVVGAADGPLGNLGVGAIEPGVVGVSLGTSGAARVVLPGSPRTLDPGLFDYLLVDGLHVVGGAASTGGLVADWAAEALAPELGDSADRPRTARLLADAAEVPTGSAGVVALPHLLPPRAPHLDPDLAGTWLGVRTHHDRRHLVRAAVEGVALHLADVVDRLEQVTHVREVRATGGALQAPLWQTSLADALDRPVTLVGAAGGTALGAAALGWMALGRADGPGPARAALVPAEDPVTVDPDPERVAALRALRQRRTALLAALVAAGAGPTPEGG